MIKSMTGFGRYEYGDKNRNVVVEIRAVNHRYCDITVKMPRRYSYAEEKLKAIVKDLIKRGKIDVSVSVENLAEPDASIKLNIFAARQYYDNFVELKQELRLTDDITLSLLVSQPDIIKIIPKLENEDEILETLSLPVREAVRNLDVMRIKEGAKLAEDIIMRGRIILSKAEQISLLAPKSTAAYKAKLQDRISELLDSSTAVLSEERIALEAAVFADKANVTEELVRLSSHISQLEQIIGKSGQPEGKKLDFLVQEMNREANTIGSKANDIDITNLVLEMKSEIEKIREQIQNIE